jgi:hypothetical protein
MREDRGARSMAESGARIDKMGSNSFPQRDTADSSAPRSISRSKAALIAVVALGVGTGIGWLLPRSEPGPAPCATPGCDESARAADLAATAPHSTEALRKALTDSLVQNTQLAGHVQFLEALIAALGEPADDLDDLTQRTIAQMDDRELRTAITTTTDLEPEDLEDVDDVQAYAARLAAIAMDGILSEANPPANADRVQFATAPPQGDPSAIARDRFERSERLIYAIFPTADYEHDYVTLKWYRTDEPQMLMLDRLRVVPEDPHGWVWIRRSEDWDAGQYQVDVYSGDEAMDRIAVGRYRVK